MLRNSDSIRIFRPGTYREAAALLKEYPGASFIAGGTDLMQKLQNRPPHVPPQILISLAEAEDLARIKRRENSVEIGAAVPLERIISLGGNVVPPLLIRVLSRIAGPAVRNLATLGGNIALASPFSDALLPLLLLEARCELRRLATHSWLPLARFIRGPWRTTLQPLELLAGVSIPAPQWNVRAYTKLDLVSQPALSLCKFAGLARVYRSTVTDFRIIWGGVDPLTVRSREIEALVIGAKVPVPAKLAGQVRERVAELIESAPPSFMPERYHRRCAARLAAAFLEEVSAYRED